MPIALVASANGDVGMDAAWDILASGGHALDAVEAGCREVEDNPDDHTVGYGGYPNLEGIVELDASIMDGETRRAGAVGGLRGYRAAVTVARAVLDRLPHVLVVGEGAARLAAEIGLQAEDLLTDEAARVWEDGLSGRLDGGSLGARMLALVSELATDPDRARAVAGADGQPSGPPDASTVNFIAIDGNGRMASAVSTSGWAWKYPGRLGDTPIIGAGNYCDGRYGAATCTGFGELAIRASTARTTVSMMQMGMGPEESLLGAVRDLETLGTPREQLIMHAIALTPAGDHAGVTTRAAGAEY
ncbi:MAG: isoaspartyl peptidase/L-asparaginase, partial [Acidimicrobiales bacterium]